jgi:mRNA interferase RelE/StbE
MIYMPIEIIISESAVKQVKKMDRGIIKRLFTSVYNLRADSRERVCRVTNTPFYRLRVGDFRVIFDIMDGKLRILLIKSAS